MFHLHVTCISLQRVVSTVVPFVTLWPCNVCPVVPFVTMGLVMNLSLLAEVSFVCSHETMYGAVCYIHDMHALSRYAIDCMVLNSCSMLLSAWHNHNVAMEAFL